MPENSTSFSSFTIAISLKPNLPWNSSWIATDFTFALIGESPHRSPKGSLKQSRSVAVSKSPRVTCNLKYVNFCLLHMKWKVFHLTIGIKGILELKKLEITVAWVINNNVSRLNISTHNLFRFLFLNALGYTQLAAVNTCLELISAPAHPGTIVPSWSYSKSAIHGNSPKAAVKLPTDGSVL